jgi:hypothetical protein
LDVGELDGLDLVGEACACDGEGGAREGEAGDEGGGGDVGVATREGVADGLDTVNMDYDLRGGLLGIEEIEGDWLIEKVGRVVVYPGG